MELKYEKANRTGYMLGATFFREAKEIDTTEIVFTAEELALGWERLLASGLLLPKYYKRTDTGAILEHKYTETAVIRLIGFAADRMRGHENYEDIWSPLLNDVPYPQVIPRYTREQRESDNDW